MQKALLLLKNCKNPPALIWNGLRRLEAPPPGPKFLATLLFLRIIFSQLTFLHNEYRFRTLNIDSEKLQQKHCCTWGDFCFWLILIAYII